MIVCSCNFLSDSDVKEAIRAGARRPSSIYAHKKCRAECGKCSKTLCYLLKENNKKCCKTT